MRGFTFTLTFICRNFRAQNEQTYITSPLAGCAELLRAQGYFKQAARVLGLVAAHPQAAHRIFLLEIDAVEYHRTLDAMRAQLDESDFANAWDEGQRAAFEKIVELALNL